MVVTFIELTVKAMYKNAVDYLSISYHLYKWIRLKLLYNKLFA